MITLEKLIERIETRIQLASGIDTQILYETKIVEMIRHKYNVLFDSHWFDDYTVFDTFTLDGTTGMVTVDLSSKIERFGDIHSIYYNNDDEPLPKMLAGVNPSRIRTRSYSAVADPTKVFRVHPLYETGPIHVWYRNRIRADVWDSQDYSAIINMDDEVIILGVMHDFMVSDGSNPEEAQKVGGMFAARVKQLKSMQWEGGISKRSLAHDGPLDRWE